MDLSGNLKSLAEKAKAMSDSIRSEEATKQALVLPFLQAMGYDVFDPAEFVPEYDANVPGTKRGEKVDYAVLIDGKPALIIEAKSLGTRLTRDHASQLFKYFAATPVRIAVLTNGVDYKFYTDFQAENIMDMDPLLEIRLDRLDGRLMPLLELMRRDGFDAGKIRETAFREKYADEFLDVLRGQAVRPDRRLTGLFMALCGLEGDAGRYSDSMALALRRFSSAGVGPAAGRIVSEPTTKPVDDGRMDGWKLEWWKLFNEIAFQDAAFAERFKKAALKDRRYQDFQCGVINAHICLVIADSADEIRVKFYIRRGRELYNELLAQKDDIERELGRPVAWVAEDDKTACRLEITVPADFGDRPAWPGQVQAAASLMMKMWDVVVTRAVKIAGASDSKPAGFRIMTDGKAAEYPFSSHVGMTVNYFEAVMDKYGADAFTDWVIGHEFRRGNKSGGRKVFSMSKDDMRGFPFHRFGNGLCFLKNFSAASLVDIREQVSAMFPAVALEYVAR